MRQFRSFGVWDYESLEEFKSLGDSLDGLGVWEFMSIAAVDCLGVWEFGIVGIVRCLGVCEVES